MSKVIISEQATCLVPTIEAGLPDIAKLRSHFPVFRQNPELLYFDNASTSQKPDSVIQAIRTFYEEECSNIARANYSKSTQLEKKVEEARTVVSTFINADSKDVAFTSGATESLNLVAMCWGLKNLKDGDEVMLCLEDHHSATYPWFNLKTILSRFGIEIKIVPFKIHHTGVYDWEDIKSKVTDNTKLIALSHIHHLYGMEMDIKEILQFIPDHILISLDASQSAGHLKIDVKNLGVDFISFSGHKMFASNGVGILWVDEKVKENLWPVQAGSKTSFTVDDTQIQLSTDSLSGIIECGTPNIAGILSLTPAVNFIESIGLETIEYHISKLTGYFYENLKQVPGIEFGPGIGQCGCTRGFGIIPFKLKNMQSSDLAAFLDSEGIMVRSGDHCLGARSDSDSYIRVSLKVYNTENEIDYFMEVLEDACS